MTEGTPATYSAKSAAIRAAKKALGADAILTLDFAVEQVDGRWTWFAPEGGPSASPLDHQTANPSPTDIADGLVEGMGGGIGKGEALPALSGANPDKVITDEIAAVHVPGEANHFRLNEAGQKAVAEARAAEAPKRKTTKRQIEALARAERGELPEAPDFSAETHKRWRPRLAEVVAMAEKGDLKGLKRYEIKPISTSPKAIDRYRNLAVVALEARKRSTTESELLS